jgi:hypothetical protein
MSPLGLASLKRKNLPIVVTLGGIGSCYASLSLYLIAFYPSYKLCDNKDRSLEHLSPLWRIIVGVKNSRVIKNAG